MNNVQCFIKDFTLINSDLQKALDFSYGAHDTILIVFSVIWREGGGAVQIKSILRYMIL